MMSQLHTKSYKTDQELKPTNDLKMAYLTRDQLDNYLKGLSTKIPKPENSSPRSSSPTPVTVPPNSPLGPKNLETTNFSPDTIDPVQELIKPVEAPSDTSPLTDVNPPVELNSASNKEYKSLDDLVNDLSYPMQTKLSFAPNSTDNTPPAQNPLEDNSSESSPKAIPTLQNESKGQYVLSAFKSYNSASRSPTTKPLPKLDRQSPSSSKSNSPPLAPVGEQTPAKIALSKETLPLQEDPRWDEKLDETEQKFPPIQEFEKEPPATMASDANNITNEEIGTITSDVQAEWSDERPEKIVPPEPVATTDSDPQTTPKQPDASTLPLDICAGCGKRISGNILTAMGRRWHPEHFGCKHCSIPLEHVAFFEKDGEPYCHLDYHELFSPRCGHCQTPIEGDCVNALGKSWHLGHFFCRECGEPFDGGFMVNEGFPYCKKDWVKLFAPKCKGCQDPIQGEYVNAMDGTWHRNCFVCTACLQPFKSGRFSVHNDKPYCEKHYQTVRALANEK